MKKYDNIVIAADYITDLCIQEYESIYTGISEESRRNYPKSIRSSECMQILGDIVSEKEVLERRDTSRYALLQSTSDPSTLSDSDKLSLFCTHTQDGIFDCP